MERAVKAKCLPKEPTRSFSVGNNSHAHCWLYTNPNCFSHSFQHQKTQIAHKLHVKTFVRNWRDVFIFTSGVFFRDILLYSYKKSSPLRFFGIWNAVKSVTVNQCCSFQQSTCRVHLWKWQNYVPFLVFLNILSNQLVNQMCMSYEVLTKPFVDLTTYSLWRWTEETVRW